MLLGDVLEIIGAVLVTAGALLLAAGLVSWIVGAGVGLFVFGAFTLYVAQGWAETPLRKSSPEEDA